MLSLIKKEIFFQFELLNGPEWCADKKSSIAADYSHLIEISAVNFCKHDIGGGFLLKYSCTKKLINDSQQGTHR